MWWKIALLLVIVVFVLLFIFSAFEVTIILFPKSRLSQMFKWGKAPEPVTDAEKVCKANRDAIITRAAQWDANTMHLELSIQSKDGLRLYAYEYLQPLESHKWVVVAHGYRASIKESTEFGMYYYERGYNVLTPIDRAHGISEGSCVGMGWLDKDDILIWINQIIAKDPQAQIVLHGVSMGGATVMMVSGESTLPRNVFCIIEDCGYTSVWDEFVCQAMNVIHLLPYPLVPMCSLISKIRCKYSFLQASSVKQVKKSVTPILFIHGGNDMFVPTKMIYKNVAAACTSRKSLKELPHDMLIVPDAKHAMSKNQNPDLYWNKVFSFISEYAD